jgi:hypothetical protein
MADGLGIVPIMQAGGWKSMTCSADMWSTRRSDFMRGCENSGATMHQRDRALVEAVGAKLFDLLLQRAAVRTVSGLWRIIGECLDCLTPRECANHFEAARCEPSGRETAKRIR